MLWSYDESERLPTVSSRNGEHSKYVILLSRYIVVRGREVLVRFGALSNASVEPGQPDVAMSKERAGAEFTRTLGSWGRLVK